MVLKIQFFLLISLFSFVSQASLKCEWFLTGSSKELFQDPTKIVDSFYQPDGSEVFLRKTQITFIHKLMLLNLSSRTLTRDLKVHLRNREFSFWLQALIAVKQLYLMPTKDFNRLFPGMERRFADLRQILLFFQVQLYIDPEILNNLSWISEKSLIVHFKKHGQKEFGVQSPVEYFKLAKSFAERKNHDFQITLKIRGNTILKYDALTFEVVIIENGLITTFFRLTEDYRPQNEFDSFIGKLLAEGLAQ